jgi:glucan 1,3-beta-glucosidase
LLRGEQTPVALTAMLKRVKEATGIPVTYADVSDFWVPGNDRVGPGLSELAAATDFITIHILPYWEDQPIASGDGVAHLKQIYGIIKAAYPEKQILIGETGFPSAGRQRDGAVPSIVDEARYIREFIAYANSIKLDYNMIEAFDQPWKRDLEGTVGGYWGVFSGDRAQKFPLTGPVSNYPDWHADWYLVIWTALAILAVAAIPHRHVINPAQSFAAPLLAFVAAALLVLYGRRVQVVDFLWYERALGGALYAVALLTAVIGLKTFMEARTDQIRGSVATLLADFSTAKRSGMMLTLAQLISVVGATVVSLGLAFDARYRDFPSLAFAVPAIAHALLWLSGRDRIMSDDGSDRREEAVLALILVASSLAVPVIEGPQNVSALIWTAEAVLIAGPWLRFWPNLLLRSAGRPSGSAA